jgi:hypothetical protein
MSHHTRSVLLRQFDTAWQLTGYHLNGLTTEECLWRPARVGLHVRQDDGGRWRGEWPEHEGYTLGPPSIAWVTWHMGFWWSMALDHSFGDATLGVDDVTWPGSADGVREWLSGMAARWRAGIESLSPEELQSAERTRWPFTDRPFADVVAWATVELTKNAAELGYARFLYGASADRVAGR